MRPWFLSHFDKRSVEVQFCPTKPIKNQCKHLKNGGLKFKEASSWDCRQGKCYVMFVGFKKSQRFGINGDIFRDKHWQVRHHSRAQIQQHLRNCRSLLSRSRQQYFIYDSCKSFEYHLPIIRTSSENHVSTVNFSLMVSFPKRILQETCGKVRIQPLHTKVVQRLQAPTITFEHGGLVVGCNLPPGALDEFIIVVVVDYCCLLLRFMYAHMIRFSMSVL